MAGGKGKPRKAKGTKNKPAIKKAAMAPRPPKKPKKGKKIYC